MMREKKRVGEFTITPEMPSISIKEKVYEWPIDPTDNSEFVGGALFKVLWVNRFNFTAGFIKHEDTVASNEFDATRTNSEEPGT